MEYLECCFTTWLQIDLQLFTYYYRELHLRHYTASADPSVFGVIQESLQVLHLTFI